MNLLDHLARLDDPAAPTSPADTDTTEEGTDA